MTTVRPIGDFTGRRPPHSETTHPRMHASNVLVTGYQGAVPLVVNWFSNVTLPMALNGSIGDCAIADVSHAVEVWTKFGQGTETLIADADVLTMYERVSGYVPGNPATDRGCVIQDVLNDWRKIGIGSPPHTILAFLQVDYNNFTELKACCWLFGGVTLGVNFPQSAMDQYRNGQPWEWNPGANNTIIGGHDVRLLGVDADGTGHVATWGTVQKVTPGWLAHFCEEAWAQADGEWIKNNASPAGLSVVALNSAFQQITGQPGPFPVAPTPVPPGPPPASPSTDADHTFASVIRPWANGWHVGVAADVAKAAQIWIKAKGL